MATFIEESKIHYRRSSPEPSNDDSALKIGCLQRIANATEMMAQNHLSLMNQLKWTKDDLERVRRSNDRLARSNAALRGHMKKLKASR